MFDWLFIYWYFERFADGGSPFDHSAGLDMKTMYQQSAGVTISEAGLRDLPNELQPIEPHTHNALDDALSTSGDIRPPVRMETRNLVEKTIPVGNAVALLHPFGDRTECG